MAKNINVVLNLQDRFTVGMSRASYSALNFKKNLALAQVTSSKFKGVMNAMEKVALGTATALGGAAYIATKSCLSAYEEFNSSMNKVAGVKGIDVTTKQGKKMFEELTNAAKKAAKEVKGMTYDDAANGFYYMALAGMDVTKKTVQDALPAMLKAARINGGDIKETLDAVTDSMTALGLKTKDTEEYINTCTAVQSASNTNMLQLNDALIKCGAGMTSLGVGYKDTAALIGIMSSSGLKAEQAGTFINSQWSRMVKGSAEACKGLDELGVSLYDDTGKMKEALPFFKEMSEKLQGLSEQDRNSIMSKIGGRFRSQLNTLMTGFTEKVDEEGTAYEKIMKAIKDADDKKYTADSYINAVNQGWAGVKEVWSADWTNFKADVGEIIAPYAAEALGKLSEQLPKVLEIIKTELPPALEKGKEIVGQIKDKVEEWKPQLEWILEHWKQIAVILGTAYAGMGAFRLGTSAVESYVMLKHFGSGIGNQNTVRNAIADRELATNNPTEWIKRNAITSVGANAMYGAGTQVGNINGRGTVKGSGLTSTLAGAEKNYSKRVMSVGSDVLGEASYYPMGAVTQGAIYEAGTVVGNINGKGTVRGAGLTTKAKNSNSYKKVMSIGSDTMGSVPVYSIAETATPKTSGMYEGGSWFKKVGKGALKSAAAGEVGMATATEAGATTLGGASIGGAVAGGLGSAGSAVGGAISGIASAAGPLAIIAGIAATIALAVKNSKLFREALSRLGHAGSTFMKPLKEGFDKCAEAIQPIIPFAKNLFGLIGDIAGVAVDCLAPFVEGLAWILGSGIGGILEGIGTAFGAIGAALGPVVELVRKFVEKIDEIITKWEQLVKKGIIKNNVSSSQTGTSLNENSKDDGVPNHLRGMMPEVGNALGTNYWRGGTTLMNERGGEIVDLPRGSRIIPADQTDRLMRNMNGGTTIVLNIENFYGEDERYINRVGEKVADKIAGVVEAIG